MHCELRPPASRWRGHRHGIPGATWITTTCRSGRHRGTHWSWPIRSASSCERPTRRSTCPSRTTRHGQRSCGRHGKLNTTDARESSPGEWSSVRRMPSSSASALAAGTTRTVAALGAQCRRRIQCSALCRIGSTSMCGGPARTPTTTPSSKSTEGSYISDVTRRGSCWPFSPASTSRCIGCAHMTHRETAPRVCRWPRMCGCSTSRSSSSLFRLSHGSGTPHTFSSRLSSFVGHITSASGRIFSPNMATTFRMRRTYSRTLRRTSSAIPLL
mmetsp:Transcript_93687/g.269817  ORF Transcript_93687/g.269817 Transcript_93687/m.269817 type:complete len:271 (+) Transcript_93687:325-1137(+)